MEDVTDPSFRFICKQFGADVMYTEFIASEGLIRDASKSIKKLDIFDYERPIGIQIYGHQMDSMVEAARIAEAAKPDLIDLNFGCPVRKIATRGAGAGMLCNVPLMTALTSAVVRTVKLPVTVKTRLGWDECNKNIVDIAEKLQDTGIKAITIHGRTRAQLYKGSADWTLIGEVKKNPRMKIPVIGNGDIISPKSAEIAFNRYGVDGIMIGRGAVGHPWIFREIKHYLETGELLPDLTIAEKVSLAKIQLQKSIEWKGIPVGIYEMRRHLSNYFKGLPDFKETRLRLVTSLDPSEINSILECIIDKYH
ncbi:MAG: tRNA dihydrouridine synthase DusB [Bacteroidales bacterium]|nr:tRNA dihydrouridine synthase DusB [Bacteroidales bacterium]MBN2762987.1 tRNA dihydrouridine synthase DusB [Bacteroidales bacterium]